jgi:hypothetical protein
MIVPIKANNPVIAPIIWNWISFDSITVPLDKLLYLSKSIGADTMEPAREGINEFATKSKESI